MNIPFNRLDRGYEKYKQEYDAVALEILASGFYVQGPRLERFEEAFAVYVGAEYCVGVNSGLDALKLSLRALGIKQGDEVLVPANTYIATILAITENGGIPIFVEPDIYFNMDAGALEEKISERTKAILAVHLYGQAANMEKIAQVAKKNELFLVEDCAQSHGAKVGNRMTGSFGDAGCFSFYPTKGLGAFGDGGAILCKDKDLRDRLRKLRNYGSIEKNHHEIEGVNSRLDELQAGLLSVKLSHMDSFISERRSLAQRYLEGIRNPLIELPKLRPGCESVWHLFVVATEERDHFREYLSSKGIGTGIHYPIPPHLSQCYTYLGYKRGDFPATEKMADSIVSLPLYEGMTHEEMEYVIKIINEYRGKP